MSKFLYYCVQVLALIIASSNLVYARTSVVENMDSLHRLACPNKMESDSAWNLSNLYNCSTRQLFIPYHLWTGSKWDGKKNSDCMHKANKTLFVNKTSGTRINGPVEWKNPQTGIIEIVWTRNKLKNPKRQKFVCHESGIGRVYDSRGPRYYKVGRCKFPAGYDWKISERRYCDRTSIEIISLSFDKKKTIYVI